MSILDLRTPTHVDAAKYYFGRLRRVNFRVRDLESEWVEQVPGQRRKQLSNLAMLLVEAKELVDLTLGASKVASHLGLDHQVRLMDDVLALSKSQETSLWLKMKRLRLDGLWLREGVVHDLLDRLENTLEELQISEGVFERINWRTVIDKVIKQRSITSFILRRVWNTLSYEGLPGFLSGSLEVTESGTRCFVSSARLP